jgi:hypothetical protein
VGCASSATAEPTRAAAAAKRAKETFMLNESAEVGVETLRERSEMMVKC